MFAEGFQLMVVGMATVFAFLGLLVVAVGIAGRVIAPLEASRAGDALRDRLAADTPDCTGGDGDADEEAAIAVAVAWARAQQGAR